eukprot:gene7751-9086_t
MFKKEISARATLTKKSMLFGKRVAVVGQEGSFMAGLLAGVLVQYECRVHSIALCKDRPTSALPPMPLDGEGVPTTFVHLARCYSRGPPGADVAVAVNAEELARAMAVITDVLRDADVVIVCCEWSEYRELFDEIDVLSRCIRSVNNVASVIVAFPIGVEEINASSRSIESVFEGVPTTFLFYAALMQWLFVGPPALMGSIELPLLNDDEGCFWLDCDDLVKVVVELLLLAPIQSADNNNNNNNNNNNKMYILTGKEPVTCLEIATMMQGELGRAGDTPIVQDWSATSANAPTPDGDLQRRFFQYLRSPISTVQSPDIELILNHLPTTFSLFLNKCKDTQLFSRLTATVHRSLTTSAESLPATLTPPSLSPLPSSPALKPASTSSSSHKFVSPLSFLKYSKAFSKLLNPSPSTTPTNRHTKLVEETIYKSPPSQKRKDNSQETDQWIALLKSGFKKMLIDSPNTPDDSHLLLEDYTSETVYDITDDSQSNWQFTSYAPKIFKNIRKFYLVDNFLQSNSNNKDIVHFEEVKTIGRSGSFFYKSKDDRYFLKTIPTNEYLTFIKLFPSYYQYSNSLLPRFYGLFRLKGKLHNVSAGGNETTRDRDVVFIVMENLFYSTPLMTMHERYDLKGSTVGRFVEVDESAEVIDDEAGPLANITLKDLNFKRKIFIGPYKKLFVAQLEVDTDWMMSHSICDYSLLVGIHLPHSPTPVERRVSAGATSIARPVVTTRPPSGGSAMLPRPSPPSYHQHHQQQPQHGSGKDISFFKKDGNGIASCSLKPMATIPIRNGRTTVPSMIKQDSLNQVKFSALQITATQTSARDSSDIEYVVDEEDNEFVNHSLVTSSSTSTTTTISPVGSLTSSIDSDSSSSSSTTEESEGIVYFLGLIDTLTTYDFKKRGEHALKSVLFDKKQISAISPKDYRAREISVNLKDKDGGSCRKKKRRERGRSKIDKEDSYKSELNNFLVSTEDLHQQQHQILSSPQQLHHYQTTTTSVFFGNSANGGRASITDDEDPDDDEDDLDLMEDVSSNNNNNSHLEIDSWYSGDPLVSEVLRNERETLTSMEKRTMELENVERTITTLNETREAILSDLKTKKQVLKSVQRKKDEYIKTITNSYNSIALRYNLSQVECRSLTLILPEEVMLHIFKFLSPMDLCSGVCRVSRKWRALAFDISLWRDICLQRKLLDGSSFYTPRNPNNNNNNRLAYQQQQQLLQQQAKEQLTIEESSTMDIDKFSQQSPQVQSSNSSVWGENWYVGEFRKDSNWRRGKYSTTILRGHKEIVWSLLYESDTNSLISGSEDMTVKLWDCSRIGESSAQYTDDIEDSKKRCIKTLGGHKNGTICLGSTPTRLISGSADGSVKIWDRFEGTCIETIQTHSSVWCLQIVNNTLICGCVDGTMRVFDLNTSNCLRTMRGHSAPVRCLQAINHNGQDLVVSGSYDKTIKVWDMDSRCINTIRAHTHKINCLQYENGQLVWDMSGQLIHTLQGHDNMIHCLQFKGNKLLSGSTDSTIRLWDLKTGTHVNTIKGQSAVCCLKFNDSKLITGYEDSTIKIFDYS